MDDKVHIVLGPTNTGKTRLAIDRMVACSSGMIGLPLRLLAREVYERVAEVKGRRQAALITGEERIVPEKARYFVCTVEAMPQRRDVDFVAIDEVQLCADPDRGHVFTDRILHARGRFETMMLGAETARPLLRNLVPDAQHDTRERMSTLSFAGHIKLTKLPRRSAIVAFSADEVYGIAELLKRQRGGAAVVMGSLSPATRNAQVALYQNGEVDFLVATDAIGMGLNMDVDHVAFAGLTKFDGHRRRRLRPDELAQIAGRAGRHIQDGSFGTTGDAPPLSEDVVARIENHRFEPLHHCQWRASNLDFSSLSALDASLSRRSPRDILKRKRDALDQLTLQAAMADASMADQAGSAEAVQKIWTVCQLPDFRKTTPDQHFRLALSIMRAVMSDHGVLQDSYMAGQIRGLDDTTGEVDTLAHRLAHMRTWSYVAQRPGWLEDATHWRGVTADVEARLSEALHERLTQRFVDRETSSLLRALRSKEDVNTKIANSGEITVDGTLVGRIQGLRFIAADSGKALRAKTMRQAAEKTARPEIDRRLGGLSSAEHGDLSLTTEGGLMWNGEVVGKLVPGAHYLRPEISLTGGDLGQPALLESAQARLKRWISDQAKEILSPLTDWDAQLQKETDQISGQARGLLFHLIEHYGNSPRQFLRENLSEITKDDRRILRYWGIELGEFTIFAPKLIKPGPAGLIALLRGIALNKSPLNPPANGELVVEVPKGSSVAAYAAVGYRLCGRHAVRFDALERLAKQMREARLSPKGEFLLHASMAQSLNIKSEAMGELLPALGFRRLRAARAPEEGASGPVLPELWRRQRPKSQRPQQNAAHKQKAPQNKGQKPQKHKRQPAKPTHDPNSPFAALAELMPQGKKAGKS